MLIKLGNILKVKHGYAFKSENYIEKSRYRLVTLGNFSDNNSFNYNDSKATYYGADFPEEFILQENDLILPLTEQVVGLFGNTALVPRSDNYNFVLNQRVGKIICDLNKVDKIYLHYLLATESVKQQLEARASGTRQRNISPENIYDVTVDLPNIETQRKIAKILLLIDTQIERNNAMVKKLQVLAQAVFDRFFVNFNFLDSEGKAYKNNNGAFYFNDDIKANLPLGWNVDKIKNITKTYLGGTPSRANDEYWNGNINWINSGEVSSFPLLNTAEKITSLGLENSATKLLKKGSIVISITGNIRFSILGIDSCSNQSVVGVSETDRFKKAYLFFALLKKQKEYENMMTGAVQKHINKEIIDESFIVIPPPEVMEDYYKTNQKLINILMKASLITQKLTNLKNKLLPLLINQQLA